MVVNHRVFHAVGFTLSALALASLQACAINPLVRWEPPLRPSDAKMTLDYAKSFSEGARQAYQQKINDQVGLSTNLSSGLIGLGALVAALAAGKAHRDAIFGSTLIGATAFALGTWNLDKRRLVIYQAAVAAFNCADRAVAPLNMSEQELKTLDTKLTELAKDVAEANAAIGDTDRALNAWIASSGGKDPLVGSITAAIVAAQQAVTAATQTQAAAYALRYQATHIGDRLIDAVRKIDQEADSALTETLGDLNKVPAVIASLAGIAGSIAPGSGVEQAFGDFLKKSVDSKMFQIVGKDKGFKKGQITPPIALLNANAQMNDAVRKLAAASSEVQSRVTAFGTSAQHDTLADCGIGAISFAMSLDPSKLAVPIKTAATATVVIKGGKPPYAVHPNGIVVPSITIKGPDRLGSSFEVKVTADITSPQTAGFVIVDSSDPNRTVPFLVEITR